MKHRLAALFLTAALFCTLLAGCAPTPDVPGARRRQFVVFRKHEQRRELGERG